MHSNLVDLLACPFCKSDLSLNIVKGNFEHILEGDFSCNTCKKTFEIKDDIPFFSPQINHGGVKNQQSTYSTWWDEYHDESSIINPETRDFFYNSLQIRADEISNKVILDGGCGNGRFSFVVSQYKPKLLVSFDISSGLLHAKKAISKYHPQANVAYVQGDITYPPFKDSAFDITFSWGVIHHTPNTRKTFSGISKLVKPGGKLGTYVYEFHPRYNYQQQSHGLAAYLRSLFIIKPLRFLCSRLSAKTVHTLFIPVYRIEKALNIGFMGCHGYPEDKWNKDRYFRVVIDRFKTRYASEHTLEEIITWYQDEGFDSLRVGNQPRVSVSATKLPSENKNKSEFMNLSISYKNTRDPSLDQIINNHTELKEVI